MKMYTYEVLALSLALVVLDSTVLSSAWSSNRLNNKKIDNSRTWDLIVNDSDFIGDDLIELPGASNSKGPAGDKSHLKQWLEVDRVNSEKINARQFSDVVLECNAVGSPPPMIYWLKDGIPLGSFTGNNVHESVQNAEGFAMANVRSKLPLSCLNKRSQGMYTCVAENKARTISASTYVAVEGDSKSTAVWPQCVFRNSLNTYSKKGRKFQAPAFIMTYEYLHMETMGNDVVLPCRVGGYPKPTITWTDYNGKNVANGKKFWMNINEDLVISGLSWKEMGEYTCHAENIHGSDSASTFVYPLLNESSSTEERM